MTKRSHLTADHYFFCEQLASISKYESCCFNLFKTFLYFRNLNLSIMLKIKIRSFSLFAIFDDVVFKWNCKMSTSRYYLFGNKLSYFEVCLWVEGNFTLIRLNLFDSPTSNVGVCSYNTFLRRLTFNFDGFSEYPYFSWVNLKQYYGIIYITLWILQIIIMSLGETIIIFLYL